MSQRHAKNAASKPKYSYGCIHLFSNQCNDIPYIQNSERCIIDLSAQTVMHGTLAVVVFSSGGDSGRHYHYTQEV